MLGDDPWPGRSPSLAVVGAPNGADLFIPEAGPHKMGICYRRHAHYGGAELGLLPCSGPPHARPSAVRYMEGDRPSLSSAWVVHGVSSAVRRARLLSCLAGAHA
ncbi:hypothetical protein Dimus_027000 [Dionaea muscipula]